MPETRPIHVITETDQLSQALTQAARIWPELSGQRTLLLWKVLAAGIEGIEAHANGNTSGRVAEVHKLASSLDGVWPPDWRQELANDWPN